MYGPAFQGIQHLWQGQGEALAEVRALQASEQAGQGRPDGYHFHPAALDACIQVIFGALPAASEHFGSPGRGVYLPVEIAEVRLYGAPTARLWSHAQLVERTPQSITAHVRVFDEAGRLLWEARGLRCQAVGADAREPVETADDLLYAFQWQPAPRTGGDADGRQAGYLLTPSEIVQRVQPKAERRLAELGAGSATSATTRPWIRCRAPTSSRLLGGSASI